MTSTLISSERVAGTEVYNPAGEHLGEIQEVMIDKQSGKVSYAVMSFGGFLGIGNKVHPLPWDSFHYDVDKGGYVVSLSRDQLEGAPTYEPGQDDPNWESKEYRRRLNDYYGLPFM